eukprot:CAMPEP_0119107952 /NCGR_PEP_ID=MMETSP1180-20130426/12600_1 /TAXON_ID=3052 ORGANISM="Chlamydomonas cf sp, Strain CCMP681" /NCGR_SAMPLE_ID=MMETSP1180 /ASSEMBLY_ACC=CAM_ASM_000741 /LENGTH=200 /DNA_ID=CAMNT_0007093505 /DNA_START=44 /DNA_END=646 /DNA_ORIENTATION=-
MVTATPTAKIDIQTLVQAHLGDPRNADPTTKITAGTLWADKPAVVLVLRRPGCVLCRAEALKLWELKDQIEGLGANLVCVVHEWRDREVAAFAPEYWAGPVYHDLDKVFYKALNGGEVLKGSSLGLLNPLSDVWKRIMAARKLVPDHNLVGEGLIMGGLMVLGAGTTGATFVHIESDLGVHADHADVLSAILEAVALGQK